MKESYERVVLAKWEFPAPAGDLPGLSRHIIPEELYTKAEKLQAKIDALPLIEKEKPFLSLVGPIVVHGRRVLRIETVAYYQPRS